MAMKRILVCFLLMAMGSATGVMAQNVIVDSVKNADDATKFRRKKVAVVLSGGGAKGMAHIGALKVLERAGIPIDIITGTSMGSIVGGLYATGKDAHTLDYSSG